jgi:hypothetical protein
MRVNCWATSTLRLSFATCCGQLPEDPVGISLPTTHNYGQDLDRTTPPLSPTITPRRPAFADVASGLTTKIHEAAISEQSEKRISEDTAVGGFHTQPTYSRFDNTNRLQSSPVAVSPPPTASPISDPTTTGVSRAKSRLRAVAWRLVQDAKNTSAAPGSSNATESALGKPQTVSASRKGASLPMEKRKSKTISGEVIHERANINSLKIDLKELRIAHVIEEHSALVRYVHGIPASLVHLSRIQPPRI